MPPASRTAPPPLTFPNETALGSLTNYVSAYEGKAFAPMNSCWGIFPPLDGARIRDKRERGAAMSDRALASFDAFMGEEAAPSP